MGVSNSLCPSVLHRVLRRRGRRDGRGRLRHHLGALDDDDGSAQFVDLLPRSDGEVSKNPLYIDDGVDVGATPEAVREGKQLRRPSRVTSSERVRRVLREISVNNGFSLVMFECMQDVAEPLRGWRCYGRGLLLLHVVVVTDVSRSRRSRRAATRTRSA